MTESGEIRAGDGSNRGQTSAREGSGYRWKSGNKAFILLTRSQGAARQKHHETRRQAPAEQVVAFVTAQLKDHNLKFAASRLLELYAMIRDRGTILAGWFGHTYWGAAGSGFSGSTTSIEEAPRAKGASLQFPREATRRECKTSVVETSVVETIESHARGLYETQAFEVFRSADGGPELARFFLTKILYR